MERSGTTTEKKTYEFEYFKIWAERYAPAEAAHYLGFSQKTLAWWRTVGRGPRYAKLSNSIFYTKTDLDLWLEENRYQLLKDTENCFTITQAAKYLGFSYRTLEDWRERYTGPRFIKLPNNRIIYLKADLDDWIEGNCHNIRTRLLE